MHNVGAVTSSIEPADVDLFNKAEGSVGEVCL